MFHRGIKEVDLSHIRYCRISKNRVIIAENRLHRPDNFTALATVTGGEEICPFDRGSEHLTPDTIFSIHNEKGEWQTRVIPNLYNALSVEEPKATERIGFFERQNGMGAHEVLIETPEHDKRFGSFSAKEFGYYLQTVTARITDLEKDGRLEYVQVFKNSGAKAGASLVHPHSQIIATPFIPRRFHEELLNQKAYFKEHGRSLLEDILQEEIRLNERIIYENRSVILLAPYASFYPFEVWIVPKDHVSSLADLNESRREDLASAMRVIFGRMDVELGDFPFNMAFYERPFRCEHDPDMVMEGIEEYFRFHIRVMPRIYQLAGYEVSTGIHINPVPPELAASRLKGVR